MLVIDVGPIMTVPSDPQRPRRDRRGAGGSSGSAIDRISSPSPAELPARPRFPSSRTPAVNAGRRRGIGFMRTQRPAGSRRAGRLPACGLRELGADRQDRRRRGLRAGHATAPAAAGPGRPDPAAGLAASNVIARRIARPIRQLAATSAAVARGDLTPESTSNSGDEIGILSLAFNRMTEELARSYADLERRISERTRDLEAVRDLLDAFFRISTSRLDPDNIDKTFDSVLRFCSQLGYDLAMISLVDREAGVIRAVRATGTMTGVVGADGAADSRGRHPGRRGPRGPRDRRPRLHDRPAVRSEPPSPGSASAARSSCRWSATRCWARSRWHSGRSSTRERLDLRPLETLATHTAPAPRRALAARGDPPAQPEPGAARPGAGLAPRRRCASRPGSSSRFSTAWATVSSSPTARLVSWSSTRPPSESWAKGQTCRARPGGPAVRGLPAGSGHSIPRRRSPPDAGDPRRVGRSGRALHRLSQPHDGTWILVTGRPLRDEHGEIQGRSRRLPRHHPPQEDRAATGCAVRDDSRAGRGRFADPGRLPRSSRPSARASTGTSASFWRVEHGDPAAALRDDLAPRRPVRFPALRP